VDSLRSLIPIQIGHDQKNRLPAAEFFWINANWVRFRSKSDNGVYIMIYGRLLFSK